MGDGAFKHITVTAAEEEDVVIHAGLPSRNDERPASEAGEGLAGENLMPEDSSLEDPIAENAPLAEAETIEAAVPEDALAEKPAPSKASPKARPRKDRDDEYHPTTLDDLQGAPMPKMQKAVIIAAIVCIIGAIIYYVAFMS